MARDHGSSGSPAGGQRYSVGLRIVLVITAVAVVCNVAFTAHVLKGSPAAEPRDDALVAAAVAGGQHLRSEDDVTMPAPTQAAPSELPATRANEPVETTTETVSEPTQQQELTHAVLGGTLGEALSDPQLNEEDEEPTEPGTDHETTKDTTEEAHQTEANDAIGLTVMTPEELIKNDDAEQDEPEQNDGETAHTEMEHDEADNTPHGEVDEPAQNGPADDQLPVENEQPEETTAIPPGAAARVKSTSSALPVHYTAREKIDETSWTAVNDGMVDIRYYSDDDALQLIAQHRPNFLETYTTRLSPIEQTDYFRYVVVWVFGGLYIDSDIQFKKPVDQWLNEFGWDPQQDGWRQLETLDLVVGVEIPAPQTQFVETGWLPVLFAQFLFAGAKGSDLLLKIIEFIENSVHTVQRTAIEKTIERTGSAAFTRAILNEIDRRGIVAEALAELHDVYASDPRYPRAVLPREELEKFGQLIQLQVDGVPDQYDRVLVLPYRAFAYHPGDTFAAAPVLAFHERQNTWRSDPRGRV